MSERVTVNCKFHIARRGRRTELREGSKKPCELVPRESVSRISRLMALAIRFDNLIREGAVTNFSELANLGHVTRARVTQIMNLLNLAPEIQEAILYLPRVEQERVPVTERALRPIAAVVDWREQRQLWLRRNV